MDMKMLCRINQFCRFGCPVTQRLCRRFDRSVILAILVQMVTSHASSVPAEHISPAILPLAALYAHKESFLQQARQHATPVLLENSRTKQGWGCAWNARHQDLEL
jgi:hypothetical protein